MKINRIKHQADVLCKMFVGWQLQEDFNSLSKLGNGSLEINVLNATNKFNKNKINQLNITKIVNSWLLEDLEQNQIPAEKINKTLLNVEIKIKKPEYGNRFTNFSFNCNSNISIENKSYSSSLKDVQDFECKKI